MQDIIPIHSMSILVGMCSSSMLAFALSPRRFFFIDEPIQIKQRLVCFLSFLLFSMADLDSLWAMIPIFTLYNCAIEYSRHVYRMRLKDLIPVNEDAHSQQ